MLSTSLVELFLTAALADREDESQVKAASADTAELLDHIDEALGEPTYRIEKRASRLGVAKIMAAIDILANN